MYLVFDIETIPDQSPDAKERIAEIIKHPTNMKLEKTIAKWEEKEKPKAIESAWLKTALNGAYGQTVSIAAKYLDNNLKCADSFLDTTESQLENTLISSFYNWIGKHEHLISGNQLIGHNTNFDTTFLYHRSVIWGESPTMRIVPNGRHEKDFFCTMQAWAGYNKYISLDELCRILGTPGKTTKGSDVWPMVQAGEWSKLEQYNMNDVDKTIEVYKRLTFYKGE